VRAIGSVVRVEVLADGSSEFIEIELSRERFDAAPLANGDKVFIRPRQFRVFETGGSMGTARNLVVRDEAQGAAQ
jgi:sulfate transport system ATP-binding protein